jgi:hypothetical protein
MMMTNQREARSWVHLVVWTAGLVAIASAWGCSGSNSPAPVGADAAAAVCDQKCADAVALRALRGMMKFVYNLALQGKPAGTQDQTTPCPNGGSARVYGEAYSVAEQGATDVDLTYVFDQCSYLEKDEHAEQNFNITLAGTATQQGTISVQATATTALLISSTSMTWSGTVYDPPVSYEETNCAVTMTQDGNAVSALLCGREAGFVF